MRTWGHRSPLCPGTSALEAEDKPRVLSGTLALGAEREMAEFMGKVQEQTPGCGSDACADSLASQFVVRLPGQSTHRYSAQFFKRPLGLETGPCDPLFQPLICEPFLSLSKYPRKPDLRGSGGWVAWRGRGVFPARLCLEFKFTAVWGLWDSTSRKVELPHVEH